MLSTIARSGGFRYRPTTSASFSSNRGSPDSLNVSTRCGLQTACGPDLLDGGVRDPLRPSHRPTTPVRLTRRLLMQRRMDDRLDLLGRDRRLAAPTRPHLHRCLQALLLKPLTPPRDRRRGHPDLRRDPRGRKPVRGHQQCRRSLHITMSRSLGPRQRLKHFALRISNRQGRRR